MRAIVAGVCVLVVSACAAPAPALRAGHPADPASPSGRLVGPPAILRSARPTAAAATATDAAPPTDAGQPHDHH